MKLDIDEVLSVVKDSLTAGKVAAPTISATLDKIKALAKEIKEEEKATTAPKPRKELAALFFENPKDGVTSGYIFALDENVPAHTLPERISRVAAVYNTSKRGRKRPAKNLTETVESAPGKLFKEQQLQRKTKEKVYILQQEDKLV